VVDEITAMDKTKLVSEYQYESKRFKRTPLAKAIETLSSDDFEGRAPNSEGEKKTIAYIANQLKLANFEPANNGSYFQKVPLVSITPKSGSYMSMTTAKSKNDLKLSDEMTLWTKRVSGAESVKDSDLVFVGYGVVAPEYDWDDYAGVDMQGKTAVILVNDPGFATQNKDLFTGNAMTYYGRWTYKYEEAARQGAAGAIIVHETAPAGYPWEVVSGSWSGPSFGLVAADNNMSRANIEGWIHKDVAVNLFKDAGLDYAELKATAAAKGFKPVPMEATMSAGVTNEIDKIDSMNVVGILPGSKTPDEYIIYMGHWDHLGKKAGEGDTIYNGAVDNASGTAAILQIAKAFGLQDKRPERSIVAILVTAEEQGLLGSKHYGENPLFPLNKTIGGINIDAMNVHGATEDVTIVGYGASELEDYLKTIADKQKRNIIPDQNPEKGYFYRSDHFSLAKVGVPMLYAEGSGQYIGETKEYGEEIVKDYIANRYHKVGDEFDPEWSLQGTLQDMDMLYELGETLANDGQYPNWYEGNEFKSIRDKSIESQ